MPFSILCYHKVGPEREEGRRLNVSPARLRSHVRYFKRRGFQFALGRELDGLNARNRVVCLTFDDGYLSTLTHGREALLVEGVRATVYVVSELIGQCSSWDGEQGRPLADLSLLRAAADEGFEIGNHTSRHPNLAQLPLEKQRLAIAECKTLLDTIGAESASLCYPYGAFNADTLTAARDLGYTVGLALGGRRATADDDLLCLPRVVVAFSDSVPMLIYRLFLRPFLKRR
jgi:peptidoglycan/xylan/chitin deacetylase (PgdA/CDA1 family)